MSITPKENYLMMLRGEIPEYLPSMFEDRAGRFVEEFLTPATCPDGPIVTSLGMNGIWFGIFVVFMMAIGSITPPVGMVVYLLSGLTKVPIVKIFKEIISISFTDKNIK